MTYQKKRDEFDAAATTYLTRLTQVQSLPDVLQIIRDAAAWGLRQHLEEIEQRKVDRERYR